MDASTYYRSLFAQAWTEVLDTMGWPKSPVPALLAAVLIFLLSMFLFTRVETQSNAFTQARWYVASAIATIWIGFNLFGFFLVLSPYRLAVTAEQRLIKAGEHVAQLTGQLDDRRRQQILAVEYSQYLETGRKVLVRWVAPDATMEAKLKERELARIWLGEMDFKLREDFDPSVAARFKLGRPKEGIIGLSEPREHETRLAELDLLIREMRDGTLHTKVPTVSR